MKKTLKGWSSYQEQLRILDSRGMQIADTQKATKYLQNIGYYRLSGYSYIFRESLDSGEYYFREQTKFDDIKELYVFDKKLRILVLDAIEIIETSLRSNMSYILGEVDVQAHLNQDLFDLSKDNSKKAKKNPNWKKDSFDKLQKKIAANIKDNSKEQFIKHHLDNYDGIPIWVALEVCTFGNLSIMYSLLKEEYARQIAQEYGIQNPELFARLIHSISIIRNVCSHHGRLWNRRFGHSIKNADVIMSKHLYYGERNFFFFALAIYFLLKKILPSTKWLKNIDYEIRKCLTETSKSISKSFLYKQMGINLKGYSSPI
ncbi:Abi family protein [Francisella tularensis subsp. novicida]|uniref:Abi family protein n=1 Tax=Francisella tularensis TaxID=263 RepID=UPI0002DBE2EF|nr:Abi family protein [Francisella tularensis]AJI46218.1 abi-like family protein [Francisella tularensis subsp. novicida F6168]AJJ47558.1 abi-like family protein [Francisella tularensis subsp. novicida]APC98850.1 abi-like family protein [Francisella tularensis subsp. novicida]KFJ68837.1 abi-like family protein [Francisella tularensis subsp. novicida]MBK2344341.1 Abi family protein [Francisella tularensis subsp. novicida]